VNLSIGDKVVSGKVWQHHKREADGSLKGTAPIQSSILAHMRLSFLMDM
jgi:hypothetical protein